MIEAPRKVLTFFGLVARSPLLVSQRLTSPFDIEFHSLRSTRCLFPAPTHHLVVVALGFLHLKVGATPSSALSGRARRTSWVDVVFICKPSLMLNNLARVRLSRRSSIAPRLSSSPSCPHHFNHLAVTTLRKRGLRSCRNVSERADRPRDVLCPDSRQLAEYSRGQVSQPGFLGESGVWNCDSVGSRRRARNPHPAPSSVWARASGLPVP